MKMPTDKEIKEMDSLDNFFAPNLRGDLGVLTEQEQCFGKQDPNRVEEDLDDWLNDSLND